MSHFDTFHKKKHAIYYINSISVVIFHNRTDFFSVKTRQGWNLHDIPTTLVCHLCMSDCSLQEI
jgi:hypothetical protein